MKISIDISMYPLNQDFKPPILAFIHSLEGHPDISVKRNTMSTQIFGDFKKVMPVLNDKMYDAMQKEPSVIMVIKLVNSDLEN